MTQASIIDAVLILLTARRFTLIVVAIHLPPIVLAEALPDGVSYALAVVGLITAVLAIFPPFVGFIGLLSRKPRDQIKDDVFMAAIAAVPIAFLCALGLIIYLVGAR